VEQAKRKCVAVTGWTYPLEPYVGKMVVGELCRRGIAVIAGGRSPAVEDVAGTWSDVTSRVMEASSPDLSGVAVVLNCVGPFSATAVPLASACVAADVQYLDVSGEAEDFAAVASLEDRAVTAGVMLMPGVTFGVVPTDCLAMHLAARLPTATRLELAFSTHGGTSGGTLRTMAASMGDRGLVASAALARRSVTFPSGRGPSSRTPGVATSSRRPARAGSRTS